MIYIDDLEFTLYHTAEETLTRFEFASWTLLF